MATRVLPDSPAAFKDASWDEVLPYYEDLGERPLDNGNVEEWLADWSLFESLLSEAAALANFDYSCDTSDPAREAAQLRFGTQIGPRAHEQRVRLQRRLVELGYERPGLETMTRRFRNQMELFDEANVPLFADLSELTTQWAKVNGAMTVTWEGKEKTPSQLLPFLESSGHSSFARSPSSSSVTCSRACSIGCTTSGKRSPRMRASPTIATLRIAIRTASTTRQRIACDFTSRLRRRSFPRSSESTKGGAAG